MLTLLIVARNLTAIRFVLELGEDLSRFASGKKIASFLGLKTPSQFLQDHGIVDTEPPRFCLIRRERVHDVAIIIKID